MQDERPAPQITITDPARPGILTDLLGAGSEADRWRPSRRQWQVALSALLVVAVVAPTFVFLQHRREELAKDQAALAAIDLSVALGQDFADDKVSIAMSNHGPGLHLVSYRVNLSGFTEQRVAQDVEQQTIVGLLVPDQASCDTSLLDGSPVTMSVTVRTSRGDRITKTLATPGPDVQGMSFREAARYRCHLLTPQEAFFADVYGFERRGDSLVLSVKFTNLGRLPLTLNAVRPPDGWSVTALALPRALKPEPNTDNPIGVNTILVMRVTDCASAANPWVEASSSSRAPEIEINADLTGPSGEAALGTSRQAFGDEGDQADPRSDLFEKVCAPLS